MITTILFDIDGTLLDTTKLIQDAMIHTAYELFGLSLERHQLPSVSGKTLQECFETIVVVDDMASVYRVCAEYQAHHLHTIQMFPKVKETLHHIAQSGIAMAAVTNRADTAGDLLRAAGLHELIFPVITKLDVVNAKPHPEGILKALDHFKAETHQAIMVGDAGADILAAKNAGVTSIGVTFGPIGQEIRHFQPDYIIDSFDQLLDYI